MASLPRGVQVIVGVFLVLLLALAIGSACGPNRDSPNRSGDPLVPTSSPAPH